MKQLIAKGIFLIGVIALSFFMWLQVGKKVEELPQKKEPEVKEEKQETPLQVHIERVDQEDLLLDLEEYLQGVVGSEMPASFSLEALKAQAVAARTFVSKRAYIVDDTTSSQVYHDDEELKGIWKENYDVNMEKIKEAIQATEGEVMKYQGEFITAAFFSSCNGYTNNSEDYWKGEQPYLRSVESSWDTQIDGFEQRIIISEEDFHTKLGFQNNITSISQPERYENGYVKSITIDGIVFTGRELREKLQLRSSSFTIEHESDGYCITTKGYGHGIGMSQYGAQGMALEGKDYQAILHHYYQDIEIVELDV